tara:strand:- start:3523 stop:4272 length:750 start_codon:yes stop_codon:yes gene_type:complete
MTIKNKNKTNIRSNLTTVGRQDEKSRAIHLLGLKNSLLREANTDFYCLDGERSTDLLYSMPLDTLFYYSVKEYAKKTRHLKRIREEKGWGSLVKKKNSKKVYLNRIKCTYWWTEEVGAKCPRSVNDFGTEGLLLVQTIRPPLENLFDVENSVLCSSNNQPAIIPLKNGDVLANINNDIKAANISEVISSTSDRLELNSKDSAFSSNSMVLKSQNSRPKDPEPGTIIYNHRKKKFEGFDGEKWKTFKWED